MIFNRASPSSWQKHLASSSPQGGESLSVYGNTGATKQQTNAAAIKPIPPPLPLPGTVRAAAPVADVPADPVDGGAVDPVSGSSGCAPPGVGDGDVRRGDEVVGEGEGRGVVTTAPPSAVGAGVAPSPSATSR